MIAALLTWIQSGVSPCVENNALLLFIAGAKVVKLAKIEDARRQHTRPMQAGDL